MALTKNVTFLVLIYAVVICHVTMASGGGAHHDVRYGDVATLSQAHIFTAKLKLGFFGESSINEKEGLEHLQLAGSYEVFRSAPAIWLDAYICMGDYHLLKKNYSKAQLCYQIGASNFAKEKNLKAWQQANAGLEQIDLDR